MLYFERRQKNNKRKNSNETGLFHCQVHKCIWYLRTVIQCHGTSLEGTAVSLHFKHINRLNTADFPFLSSFFPSTNQSTSNPYHCISVLSKFMKWNSFAQYINVILSTTKCNPQFNQLSDECTHDDSVAKRVDSIEWKRKRAKAANRKRTKYRWKERETN